MGRQSVEEVRRAIQERMSHHAAHIRTHTAVRQATREAWALYERTWKEPWACSVSELPGVFRNLDLALAHAVYLEAIGEYLARGGQSRGSYLVLNPAGEISCPALGEEWRFSLNAPGAFVDEHILEVSIDSQMNLRREWVKVRPVPSPDTWFESVWKAYREDEVIR